MRCKSSGLNFKELSLDNGPFSKDATAVSFLEVMISSSRKSRRIALQGWTSSLFIAGHNAIVRGDICNLTSLSKLFLIL